MGKIVMLGGLLALASLLLGACASSSVERIGTASYSPQPPNAEVFVFTDASQVKVQYEGSELFRTAMQRFEINGRKPSAFNVAVNRVVIQTLAFQTTSRNRLAAQAHPGGNFNTRWS